MKEESISDADTALLVTAVAIISICALSYELIISSLSSYYFGSAITHFSVTIGLFMTFMGVGSWLSRKIEKNLLDSFIQIEIAVGVFGGFSALILIFCFSFTQYFYPISLILISLISIGIGLEIPVLTRILSANTSIRNSLSNVLTVDYLGALIASLLFPFILLPYLGLLKTCFLMGLLNLGVALFLTTHFKSRLKHKIKHFTMIGIASATMLLGFIYSFSISSFFDQRFYQDEIIFSAQTKYQRIVLTKFEDDLRLYLNGNLQFSSHDEHRYHQSLVHPAINTTARLDKVLVFGGGDGMAVREILKNPKVTEVTLVDIDKEMVHLASSHSVISKLNNNALNSNKLKVVFDDAFNFAKKSTTKFSAIIIDLPDPNSLEIGKLYSKEFYRILKKRLLNEDGVIVTQSSSPYFAREAFWSINKTLQTEFAFVSPYQIYLPSLGVWGFNIAMNKNLPLKTSRESYINQTLLDSFQIFDSDTDSLSVKENSLNDQKLVEYYEDGWEKWN